MPELARRDYERRYYTNNSVPEGYRISDYAQQNAQVYTLPQRRPQKAVNKKKVERNYFIHKIISVAVVSLLAFTIMPIGFNKVSKFIFNPTPYKSVKVDYQQLRFPTANYLSNHWFMGQRSFENIKTKKPVMDELIEGYELTDLENQLKNLASAYPSIHPSIYVWEY